MMLEGIKKFYLYTKNIRKTGAIYETSYEVTKEAAQFIDGSRKQIIVELGSGTGNITKAIIRKMHSGSKVYCFEINPEMVSYMTQQISNENVVIFNKSALAYNELINEPVDVVISSLPLSFFSEKERLSLFQGINETMKSNSKLSVILYNYTHKQKIKKFFSLVSQRLVFKNIPPLFVFHFQKNK